MSDALFPPTLAERLAVVAKFVAEERGHRTHMLAKFADDAGQLRYWGKRVAQCDEVKMHLEALAEAVAP